MKENKRAIGWLALALALMLVLITGVASAAAGKERFGWAVIDKLTVVDATTMIGSLNGQDAVDFDSTLNVDGASTFGGVINQALGIENVGGLPSVITATLPYTPATGTLWTVGASEIWFIYAVYCEVTTNFDCTGDDCTLTIGDGNDADGFLVLIDAEMQTTDAEFTGAPAGWKGLHTDSMGAYLSGLAPFVYDGTDTIDYAAGGTAPAAGSATCYVVYQRVQ